MHRTLAVLALVAALAVAAAALAPTPGAVAQQAPPSRSSAVAAADKAAYVAGETITLTVTLERTSGDRRPQNVSAVAGGSLRSHRASGHAGVFKATGAAPAWDDAAGRISWTVTLAPPAHGRGGLAAVSAQAWLGGQHDPLRVDLPAIPYRDARASGSATYVNPAHVTHQVFNYERGRVTYHLSTGSKVQRPMTALELAAGDHGRELDGSAHDAAGYHAGPR